MGLEAYRRKVHEAKHTSILTAARDIFMRYGFSNAAMADIAKQADVSTATLYKHFRSKEELFDAIVEEEINQFDADIPANLADRPIREALRLATHNYLNMQFQGGANAMIRAVISEASNNPKLGRQYYEHGVLQRNASFIAFLKTLEAKGKLKLGPDPLIPTRHILGLIKESLVWPAMFDIGFKPDNDADQHIDEAIDTFLARYGT